MNKFTCQHCGKVNERSLVNGGGLAVARSKGRRGGRPPALDAAGVKAAEDMLREGKEIRDIARDLICSERTIRRVLAGKHKFSTSPML